MSTERDELANLIASVTIDTKSGDVLRVHPDGETPVFEGDQRTADAILAAGYRKPRQVTTVEELDALPLRSIVRDGDGETWELTDNGWRYWVYGDEAFKSHGLTFPATVLHVGGAE